MLAKLLWCAALLLLGAAALAAAERLPASNTATIAIAEAPVDPVIIGSNEPVRFKVANFAANNISTIVVLMPSQRVLRGFPDVVAVEAVRSPAALEDDEFVGVFSVCATSAVSCPPGEYIIYLRTTLGEVVSNGLPSYVTFELPPRAGLALVLTLPVSLAALARRSTDAEAVVHNGLQSDLGLELAARISTAALAAVNATHTAWTFAVMDAAAAPAEGVINQLRDSVASVGTVLGSFFGRLGAPAPPEPVLLLACGYYWVGVECRTPEPPAPLAPATPLWQLDTIALASVASALALALVTTLLAFRRQRLCFKPRHVTFDSEAPYVFADESRGQRDAPLFDGYGTDAGLLSGSGSMLSSALLHGGDSHGDGYPATWR